MQNGGSRPISPWYSSDTMWLYFHSVVRPGQYGSLGFQYRSGGFKGTLVIGNLRPWTDRYLDWDSSPHKIYRAAAGAL